MTKVVIYTDFDGTVTGRVGSNAVFSPFYQSLLVGYKEDVIQDYKQVAMKEPEEVQRLFIDKFGIYNESFDHSQNDADMLMSPDAITFFHELLKNNDVKVNIVTRNRVEYIRAMFKYQGFSDKEIAKLTVMESGLKFQDVYNNLGSLQKKASYLYILDDDDTHDYPAMIQAATSRGYQADQIRGFNEQPGTFNWSTYLKDIQELYSIKDSAKDSRLERVEEEHNDLSSSNDSNFDNVVNQPLITKTSDEQVTPKAEPNYRAANIAGVSLIIGFTIGFLIGIALVTSGVFTPFGIGALGALALGATLAGSTGLLTGSIGYIAAVGTESTPESQPTDEHTVEHDTSHVAMRDLGGSLSQKQQTDAPVSHFPSVLADTSSKGTTAADKPADTLDNTFKL